jgi:flagellar capping protein FliD
MGIAFNKDGTIAIDGKKLSDALNTNPAAAKDVLGKSSGGAFGGYPGQQGLYQGLVLDMML